MPQIIPSTEPFFFPGNEIGCLLTHGFTGTPKEMRWMGEYLHKQGFTVLGVRLAGHATRPEDMIRTNHNDWLACVEDGFHLLAGTAKRIYLMGLSMGGVLSLTTASYLPVSGVVAMSTPYKLLDDSHLGHTEALSKIQPYMPKAKDAPDATWFDKEIFQKPHLLPPEPGAFPRELNKLEAKMRTVLPQVKVPVLLIHSHDDPYVWRESMPSIYAGLGSTDKVMLWIEKSGHVITRDAQREAVFHAAASFVRRMEKTAAQ